jgi:hypothetical protein
MILLRFSNKNHDKLPALHLDNERICYSQATTESVHSLTQDDPGYYVEK